jgi:hypothetical protein
VTVIVSGCCAQKPVAVVQPVSVAGKTGRRITYQESQLVRVPDRIHVYKVGRMPSDQDESMQEAGNFYHIEQSAYWNRFVPGSRVVPTGSSEAAGARVYRGVPNDQQLSELRSEAQIEKQKIASELDQVQLAKERLNGMTQGIAHTNEVLQTAQKQMTRLKSENEDLKRKAALKDLNKPGNSDFLTFEQSRHDKEPDELPIAPAQ